MVMNRGFIEEFTTFLEELRNELEVARQTFVAVETQVARLETQVQSAEDSIAAYRDRHGMPVPDVNHGHNGHFEYGELTAQRRVFLREWARLHGGRLLIRDIRAPMIQEGLFRDALQCRQQIGRIMEDMECWERVRGRRGAYRLVSPNGH